MKNIHVLPTDKPSSLWIDNDTDKIVYGVLSIDNIHNCKNQNIYITSDEEIKEEDWFIAKNKVLLCTQVTSTIIASNTSNGGAFSYSQSKKIILTTDQHLIKDGVQAIDDEFLEWFVKNSSCEEVKAFHQDVYSMGKWDRRYKIIIPKSELASKLKQILDNMSQEEFDEEWKKVTDLKMEGPSIIIQKEELEQIEQDNPVTRGSTALVKQETLEEAVAKKLYPHNDGFQIMDIDISEELQLAFINGAKWQKERSYSEDEVKDIVEQTIEKFYKHFYTLTKAEMKEQWFEQFKKK